MRNSKSYTVIEAIQTITEQNEVIFEIREKKELGCWNEHMLLLAVIGMNGSILLKYFVKPLPKITPYQWKEESFIPLSLNLNWYISELKREDIQKSMNEMGIRK